MFSSQFTFTIGVLLGTLAAAQQAGWESGEVNSTMCFWTNPRAGIIRDTVYLDGGELWWLPGMIDGTYGPPISDGNPLGLIYTLNFSVPFNTSQNISALFQTISKASAGGNANNIGPQYIDGAMFANDYEWVTYGGLYTATDAYQSPDSQTVAAYYQYSDDPSRRFSPGYALINLPPSLNRYVTYGAGSNVPSENLGFYFSGLRSPTWEQIFANPENDSVKADTNSPTLIELDMSIEQEQMWNNYTLPSNIPGRASAELAWVPVSKQGILVAIGGVIDPAYINVNESNSASVNAASGNVSGQFMSNVAVYDIAGKVWYEQPTSGLVPPQLAEGCSVVASASDGSSHNIYWYGGFDGLHELVPYSDDVWVLSVPSFTWFKLTSGNNETHGRVGHRCVKPYPDQMFVIGGSGSLSATGPPTCLGGGLIQIFNLSSGVWLDSYDPKVWSNYAVPQMVVETIGGTHSGGATQLAPTPTGFANSSLASLFTQGYNMSKITTWYPYTETSKSPSPTPTPKPGTPSYLAPLLGVVLGVLFLTVVILVFLLYWRRKPLMLSSRYGHSDSGTNSWTWKWIRNIPVETKAPTVTTDEITESTHDDDGPNTFESGGVQVHELLGMSQPVELQASSIRGPAPVPEPAPSHNQYMGEEGTSSYDSNWSTINPGTFRQGNALDAGDLGSHTQNLSNASYNSSSSESDISNSVALLTSSQHPPDVVPSQKTNRPSLVSPLTPTDGERRFFG